MNRRSRTLASLPILFGAVTAAGCGDAGAPPDGTAAAFDTARYGGTAVVGFLAEAQSMNELVSADENSDQLQSHVLFTTLLRYDADLRPIPYLATEWDTARTNDGLELTFHLRRDVRWHDGVPTTAHDVKFTFDRVKDPRTAYPHAAVFALYDSAVVRDSFTIAFHLTPHADYLDPWRTLSPMPRHILGDVPPEEMARHPFGTRSPVGNGPFRFVEHRPGDRWIFESNPDFPEALGGRPYIDRLVYRVIPEPTTLLTEFLAGEVDVYLAVVPDQVDRIRRSPAARLVTYPTRNYAFIAWNGRRDLFAEPTVRRALTLAIDRAEIVRATRDGLGAIAAGPVPPWHWGAHPELEPLPHDPARARRLLDQAGWIDRDGDGVRDRDGTPFRFEMKTNPNRVREDIMTMVQADLAEVEIDARPRVQEAQSLLQDVTAPERRFDALVLGWSSTFRVYDSDQDLFACSALETPYQFAGYCNPRVDTLLQRLAVTPDRERALPLWREYQETLQGDQPFTFIYYETIAHGVRERLRGTEMDIRGSLLNARGWWISGDRGRPATAAAAR